MLFKNDAYLIDENLVAWRIHDRSSWTSLDKEKNVKKSIESTEKYLKELENKKKSKPKKKSAKKASSRLKNIGKGKK